MPLYLFTFRIELLQQINHNTLPIAYLRDLISSLDTNIPHFSLIKASRKPMERQQRPEGERLPSRQDKEAQTFCSEPNSAQGSLPIETNSKMGLPSYIPEEFANDPSVTDLTTGMLHELCYNCQYVDRS